METSKYNCKLNHKQGTEVKPPNIAEPVTNQGKTSKNENMESIQIEKTWNLFKFNAFYNGEKK